MSEWLRQRVVDELTTTFASRYMRIIGLAETLMPRSHRGLSWPRK